MKRLHTVGDVRRLLADHADHTPVLLQVEPKHGLSHRGPLDSLRGHTTSDGAYVVLTAPEEED